MDIRQIKDFIIVNEKVPFILEELGCHHVKSNDGGRYISAGFPDGDNTKAIVVYSESLIVDSYTRNIEDSYGASDIISLVCFIKDMYFSQALKWLTDTLGLDYYSDEDVEIPMSLQITQMLLDMSNGMDKAEENERLKPIDEKVLTYYRPYVNDLFANDGIDYKTQKEFEIGIDPQSQRITIPIRDEIGTLVGVKGRSVTKCSDEEKYLYLERCAKTKILFGLHKTMPYIKESGEIIIVESEKSVMALWSHGIKNAVAIGGHKLSKVQVEKITRLGVSNVVICYDSDVARLDSGKVDKNEYLKEANKFIKSISVYAMVDLDGSILNEKESPVDDIGKYRSLYNNKKRLQ